MSAVLGWLLPLQGVGAVILVATWAAAGVMNDRTAATRRALWAVAFAILLILPLARLALHPAGASVSRVLAATLVSLWGSGAIVVMLKQVLDLRAAKRLKQEASPLRTGPWPETARALSSEPHDLRLASSNTPAVAGVLTPVVLIPSQMQGLDANSRRAVLLHEFAHIARADTAVLVVAGLARALYWPNPLVWLGHQTLRDEMERAADDAVLASGVPCTTYAAQLVATARAQLDKAGRVAARGLRPRVEAILDRSRRRAGLTPSRRFAVTRLALTAIVFATLVTACEATSHGAEPATPGDPVAD